MVEISWNLPLNYCIARKISWKNLIRIVCIRKGKRIDAFFFTDTFLFKFQRNWLNIQLTRKLFFCETKLLTRKVKHKICRPYWTSYVYWYAFFSYRIGYRIASVNLFEIKFELTVILSINFAVSHMFAKGNLAGK